MDAHRPRTRAAEREDEPVTEDQGGAPGGAGGGGWQSGGPAQQGSPPDPGDAASQAATGARSAIDDVGRQIPGNAATRPAPMGLVYGDVLNRSIAYIIDAILIAIVSGILQVIIGAIFGPAVSLNLNADSLGDLTSVNYLTILLGAAVGIAVSFAYFVWFWTSQRATIGMKVLSLQVGNESNGATLVMNQAVVRWAALFGPAALSQAFWPAPVIGAILGLVSFIWFLVLLYTTWSSPTKQGLHDKYAHTMVVKTVRTVA
jgi:uncharacterized RDD family membrane protein YckC